MENRPAKQHKVSMRYTPPSNTSPAPWNQQDRSVTCLPKFACSQYAPKAMIFWVNLNWPVPITNSAWNFPRNGMILQQNARHCSISVGYGQIGTTNEQASILNGPSYWRVRLITRDF